jgi:hypothetical protein
MTKHSHFHYKTLQQIKAQEFEHFFENLNRPYYPFLNHLGEIKWMTDEEAETQHEYFIYTPGSLKRLKKKLHVKQYPQWDKLSNKEKELRLQFRAFLEKKYLGEIQPETARLIPQSWRDELNDEEIENIPITLETHQSTGWNKLLILGIFAAILLVAGALYFFPHGSPRQTGNIVIESNVQGASVYLNDTKKGYADFRRMIRDIHAGPTRVSIKKAGYISRPQFYDVDIKADTTITLYFNLEAIQLQDQGYLKLLADYDDSKIFINNDFYGILSENALIPLKEGNYVVSLEKRGYESNPEDEYISVLAEDTSVIVFQQSPVSVKRNTARSDRALSGGGALEISANINGAKIYLNDQDTGKKTDYLFTEIPPGTYRIRVAREGYQSIPPEHRLTLTSANPMAEISFELIKQFEEVTIRTNPPEGDIYIDGKLMAKGEFEGRLEIGQHKLTFGNIPGFNKPSEQVIKVQPNAPVDLQIQYFPQILIEAQIADDGNVLTKGCEVKNGYTAGNRGFTASNEAGPGIEYFSDLNNYYWKFGFAFPFRNPKGNDALKISFQLPQEQSDGQQFTLKLQAAACRDRYPLSLSTKVEIKISFNGHILSYNYNPRFFDELNGMEELEWDVTRFIKRGLNTLEISVTDDNNTYYLVKKISIFN